MNGKKVCVRALAQSDGVCKIKFAVSYDGKTEEVIDFFPRFAAQKVVK